MTIYTSLPIELVLEGLNRDMEPHQEVWVNGVFMQVEPVAPGMGKIVRLLQCSLDDYLNPALAPGSIVMYGQAK